MENPYKRKKEPTLNRKLILDAAAEIGAVEDWHQVTFQAISDKTGISKGGIIHHFANKDILLEVLMTDGLHELTEWINNEIESTGEQDRSKAYLRFVVGKGNDPAYRRTMKVVMRVIMTDDRYLKIWDNWFSENIKVNKDSGIDDLIVVLVADGLWYADNLGLYGLSSDIKKSIFEKLSVAKLS